MSMPACHTARSAACPTGSCAPSAAGLAAARERSGSSAQTDGARGAALELDFDDLAEALEAGYAVIDIRDPAESVADPLPGPARGAVQHIPMAELLAGRNLPPDGRYLLVCARGLRSRSACETLRGRGLEDVWSLKGGTRRLTARA